MRRSGLSTFLGMCMLGLIAGVGNAQQSTTTEVKPFEVVSVDGNKVVVKGAQGPKEYTVPEDFRFDVDGRQVSVHELKPGMKGTAKITTITTVSPVHVTEVRNAEVMKVVGNSIIVRGQNGIRMFSEGDATKRGIRIMKDGQLVAFSDIHQGDHLTATIITEGAPKVMTQRQVEASLSGVPAAPAAAESRVASAAPTPGGDTAAPAPSRRLPKTASPLPLVALSAVTLLSLGGVLTLRRRRLE